MKYVLFAMIGVVAIGCSAITYKVKNNNANISSLSVGMTKTQVLKIMGPVGKSEAYETKTNSVLEFLFYRTEAANPDFAGRGEFGTVTDRHWTPICFIDGKLKGWGRNFYDDTIKIRKEVIQR
jgi:hypothetical protein